MRRWFVVLLLVLPVLAFAAFYLSREGTAVFLITLDTVRADHLGCYGFSRARTPFIDKLASQGTVFDHAITAASFTPASHASILTALYPPRHGVRFLWGFAETHLNPGVRTLAEVFRGAGFQTAAFVSSRPMQKSVYNLDRGFDVYDESFLEESPREERPRASQLWNQRRGDETLSACLKWLEERKPARFFALIHLFDAHDAQIDPPPEFRREYIARLKPGEKFDHYDFEIAWMDLQLKDFFEKIRNRLGRMRMLVVVVGDHGQGLGDHGYPRHGERLFQEQLRVPLIVTGEGVARGVRIDPYVRTVDILPTIAELMSVSAPAGIDGASLVPVMKGTDMSDRVCYSETLHPLSKGRDALFSIISHRRKLIYAPQSGRCEYYNLATDPTELHDLAPNGGYDDLLGQLKQHDLSTDFEKSKRSDPEIEEGLRALGYVN